MQIEKRYKDEQKWFDIEDDLVLAFLSQEYNNARALLEDMKANPGQIVTCPYAIYRARQHQPANQP